MEDIQIIALYWARDPEAIEQSNQKYGAYCFAVAKHILWSREDAEECVNDTWLGAWNRIPPNRPDILRMFLAKITRRIACNCVKANHTKKRGSGQLTLVLEELAECVVGGTEVEDTVIAAELETKIAQFVRDLPVQEGDVFVRRYFFVENIAEIARYYGLTKNHTTVMLCRTRKKLKEYLLKEGYL